MHGITVYREPSTDASYLTQINSAWKPAVNALNYKHFTSTKYTGTFFKSDSAYKSVVHLQRSNHITPNFRVTYITSK